MKLVFDVDEDADLLVESMNDGGFLHKHPEYEDEVEQGAPFQHQRSYLELDLERRYCVESRGRLLMIERYCWRYSHRGVRRTSLFKVFTRLPVQLEEYASPFEAWVELESLDGEVLFLGGSAPGRSPHQSTTLMRTASTSPMTIARRKTRTSP
jgi:hypothetical protein